MEDNLWLILIVLVTSFFTVQVSSKALGEFRTPMTKSQLYGNNARVVSKH